MKLDPSMEAAGVITHHMGLAERDALIPAKTEKLTGFDERGRETEGPARAESRGAALAMIPDRTSAGRFSVKPLGLDGPIQEKHSNRNFFHHCRIVD